MASTAAAIAVACLVSALPAAAGRAADMGPLPVWHCWYGERPEHVSCFKPSPDGATAEDRYKGKAVAPPVDPDPAADMLAVTRLIRRFPESFAGQMMLVPLHTIPFDIDSVEELTRTVMCPRRSCTVAFDRSDSPLVAVRAQARRPRY